MNMVRAGAVDNPLDWRHSGCVEFHALRRRGAKGIINMDSLLRCLSMDSLDGFQAWHAKVIGERLKRGTGMKRETFWRGALAVGGKTWLSELAEKEHLKRAKLSSSGAVGGEVNFLTGKS